MNAAARLATLFVLLGILLPGLPQPADAGAEEGCCRSPCCSVEAAARSCCSAEDGAAAIVKLVSTCGCGAPHDPAVGPVKHMTWFLSPVRADVRAPQRAHAIAPREAYLREAWAQSPEPPVPRRAVG